MWEVTAMLPILQCRKHFYHFCLWASPAAPSLATTATLNRKLDRTCTEMILQSFNVWQPRWRIKITPLLSSKHILLFHLCFSPNEFSRHSGLNYRALLMCTATATTPEPKVLYSPPEKAHGRTCRLPSCHKHCLMSADRWETSACMVTQQPQWSNPLGRLQSQMGRLQWHKEKSHLPRWFL